MSAVDERLADRVVVRAAMRGGAPVGAVAAVPAGDDAGELRDGFAAGARDGGATVATERRGGRELVVARSPEGNGYMATKGCKAVLVYAFGARADRELTRAVFGG